jgi:hypothetical protein
MSGAAVVAAVRYYSSPQRTVEQIQKRLAAGERVELLGDRGAPLYARVRLGTANVFSKPAPFALASDEPLLLELLPETNLSGFRLSAEVFVGGVSKTEAGIFFWHREERPAESRTHWFGYISYDCEQECYALTLRTLRKEPMLDQSGGVLIGGENEVLRPVRAGPVLDERDPGVLRLLINDPVPKALRVPRWTTLEVEISADKIKTYWEGKLQDERTLLRMNNAFRAFLRHAPGAGFPPTDLSPTGPCGLLVSGGSAKFRRVVVEPLH